MLNKRIPAPYLCNLTTGGKRRYLLYHIRYVGTGYWYLYEGQKDSLRRGAVSVADPDPHLFRAKMTYKNRKVKKFES